ncbi:MAG TPA: ABC transporter permease [Polyangia bacterium]|nr:ABC transporter permease [Polyangia bacterium]
MRPALWYRALLRLYPASFRDEWGDEMWRVHRQRRRDARGPLAVAALIAAAVADALATAARTQWDVLRQDLSYALRTLRRTPGFTITVLLVTALGIGANAAAFSLTDYVLLRPLPFADSDRLVALWQSQGNVLAHWEVSPTNYREWKKAAAFDGAGATWIISGNLVGRGEPQRLDGAALTAEVLPVLGVSPALGRGFTADDDRDGAPGTVLLSWGLWQTAFAGDEGVLGQRISLDGEPYTVIGVMPAGFAYPLRETQFWRPMRFNADAFQDASNTYLRVIGRLKPGVSIAEATAQLDSIASALERAHPDEDKSLRSFVRPLREDVSLRSRTLVLTLTGAALCVLFIACLNIANLLLARALTRRRELALRAALGAGSSRLVRQLVTESLVVAVAGGALGLGLAALALPLLTGLVPADLPVRAMPSIDPRVLGAAALATVLAALFFGVVPSLRACRGIDSDGLREGARAGVGGRRGRLVRAIVVAEVAASLVLLVSSGLLLRSLWRVQSRDPGFRAGGVLTLRTWLPHPKYDVTAVRARFYDRVLRATRALPGVKNAAYASFMPMAMGGGIWPITITGEPPVKGVKPTVSLRYVTPKYFATLGIPLRSGRDVGDGDAQDRPFVAVVSESFARRHWPGQSALGRRFNVAFEERTVVGVVGDVRVRGPERESEPQVYVPYRQIKDGWMPFYAPKDLAVRAAGDPTTLLPALRAIIHDADPEQPISNVQLLDDIVGTQTAPRRTQLWVIVAFAGLAFLLAAIGIYGLLSFAVSNRAQEIGVRMAVGATPASILRMVLREGLMLAAIGTALGLGAAWAAGRSLEALLVGVAPTDTPTLAVALGLVALMTLAGSLVPAWRASRTDPASVIRAE